MAKIITNFGNERFEGTSEEFREVLKTKLAAPDQMNPLAHAVYDQVIEEFISGDTSCFFQTLCQIEDLNNPSIKEFMQGYLKETEDENI